jgi:hypothetical protein
MARIILLVLLLVGCDAGKSRGTPELEEQCVSVQMHTAGYNLSTVACPITYCA